MATARRTGDGRTSGEQQRARAGCSTLRSTPTSPPPRVYFSYSGEQHRRRRRHGGGACAALGHDAAEPRGDLPPEPQGQRATATSARAWCSAATRTLFITLGEAPAGSPAQDLGQTLGRSGAHQPRRQPRRQPQPGRRCAAGIWSYGHRNPQGAALHPTTGWLWQAAWSAGWRRDPTSRAGQNRLAQTSASAATSATISRHRQHQLPHRRRQCTSRPTSEPLTFLVPTSPGGPTHRHAALDAGVAGNLFVTAAGGTGLWRLTLTAADTMAAQETVDFPELATRIATSTGPDAARSTFGAHRRQRRQRAHRALSLHACGRKASTIRNSDASRVPG